MSYRILVKELWDLPSPDCGPIYFRSDRYILTDLGIRSYPEQIEKSTALLRSVFPRIFGKDDNYFKQFITKEYFQTDKVWIAIERKTNTVVSHFGCQPLKNFCPNSCVLIYVATDKNHRKMGLMKELCHQMLTHLNFYTKYDRVYCIPGEGDLISDIYQRLGFRPTSEEFTKKHLKHIQKDLPME